MDQIEAAWGAGFFDGEGSSFIKKQTRGRTQFTTYRLAVAVGQSSDKGVPDTLLRLQQVIGGKIYKLSMDSPAIRGRGYKQKYKLQVESLAGRRAMAILIPYLSEAKLEQYDRARERMVIAKELQRLTSKEAL